MEGMFMLRCDNCDTILSKRHQKVFCSNSCQQDKQYKLYIERWQNGFEKGHIGKTIQLSGHVRRWLHENRGTACEVCGWDIKHPVDGRTLTEIDHTDGDATNCTPENLKVLCPNHHAMSPFHRNRNKNSKRQR